MNEALIAMRQRARRVARHYRELRFQSGMNPLRAFVMAESLANAEEREEMRRAEVFAQFRRGE